MRLLSFALPEKREGAVLLKNGQGVSLYVRSVNQDGTARIQVAGADVVARFETPAKFAVKAGALLKGTVFFENGSVYIRIANPPQPRAFPFASFLASSGISPSEAAFHTLAFFHVSGMRMDAAIIQRILHLAKAFPLMELRACEAASLLFSKGIPLTESNLKAAIDVLEGRLTAEAMAAPLSYKDAVLPFNEEASGGSGSNADNEQGGKEKEEKNASNGFQYSPSEKEGESLDFFSAFTGGKAKKDEDSASTRLDWHVLPFRRSFANLECTGSIRFLLDSARNKAVETRVTAALEDGSSADFIVSESGCRFSLFPTPPSKALLRLSAELEKALKDEGIIAPVDYGFEANVFQAKPVNIEI